MGVCMPANARNPFCCKDVLGSIRARGKDRREGLSPQHRRSASLSCTRPSAAGCSCTRNGAEAASHSTKRPRDCDKMHRQRGNDMGNNGNRSNGMIAVDKIGTKVLFL